MERAFDSPLGWIRPPAASPGPRARTTCLSVFSTSCSPSSASAARRRTSALFADDVSPRTPHLRQQLNNHGYLTVEVTPDGADPGVVVIQLSYELIATAVAATMQLGVRLQG